MVGDAGVYWGEVGEARLGLLDTGESGGDDDLHEGDGISSGEER